MATVVLVGTLDTKGQEYAFLRDRLREHGVDVLLVDCGIMVEPLTSRTSHARRSPRRRVPTSPRSRPRATAAPPSTRWARRRRGRARASTRRDGSTGSSRVGGSGNSSIATQAMRALPVGVPKLMVSTVASGDTRPTSAPST